MESRNSWLRGNSDRRARISSPIRLRKNESSPEYNSVSLCVFAIDDGCSEQDALTDEELTEFGRLLLGNDEIQSMINELKISNQISEIEVQEEHMGMRP